MEKNAVANESQQCVSNWTTTHKALCNWDTVNISKLSLNKLSEFIFSILCPIFLKPFVIAAATLNVDCVYFENQDMCEIIFLFHYQIAL